MRSALIWCGVTAVLITLGAILGPLVDPRAWNARVQSTITLTNEATLVCPWMVVIGFIALLVWVAVRIKRDLFLSKTIPANETTRLYNAYPAEWNMTTINAANSQLASAIVSGSRLSSPTVRAVLGSGGETPLLPEPETIELTARDVTDYNPETEPHCLIVGETGSGKSNATRHMVQALSQRYDCQFVICEPGGVDWGQQVTAREDEDIANTLIDLNGELLRRQEQLRAAGVQHITQLANNPGYLFIVIEEAEAILDNLRLLDRELAKQTLIAMRNLVRMGRKPGMGGIFVTQAALGDVFDAHLRKNMNRILLFKSTQSTAQMFSLDNVRLTDLPTGKAYSVTHGGFVSFPKIPVPQLAIAHIAPTKLPPTEVVGEKMPENLPTEAITTPTVVGSRVVDEHEAFLGEVSRWWKTLPMNERNITGIQRRMFPGQAEGGSHWDDIKAALIEMRLRRGQK